MKRIFFDKNNYVAINNNNTYQTNYSFNMNDENNELLLKQIMYYYIPISYVDIVMNNLNICTHQIKNTTNYIIKNNNIMNEEKYLNNNVYFNDIAKFIYDKTYDKYKNNNNYATIINALIIYNDNVLFNLFTLYKTNNINCNFTKMMKILFYIDENDNINVKYDYNIVNMYIFLGCFFDLLKYIDNQVIELINDKSINTYNYILMSNKMSKIQLKKLYFLNIKEINNTLIDDAENIKQQLFDDLNQICKLINDVNNESNTNIGYYVLLQYYFCIIFNNSNLLNINIHEQMNLIEQFILYDKKTNIMHCELNDKKLLFDKNTTTDNEYLYDYMLNESDTLYDYNYNNENNQYDDMFNLNLNGNFNIDAYDEKLYIFSKQKFNILPQTYFNYNEYYNILSYGETIILNLIIIFTLNNDKNEINLKNINNNCLLHDFFSYNNNKYNSIKKLNNTNVYTDFVKICLNKNKLSDKILFNKTCKDNNKIEILPIKNNILNAVNLLCMDKLMINNYEIINDDTELLKNLKTNLFINFNNNDINNYNNVLIKNDNENELIFQFSLFNVYFLFNKNHGSCILKFDNNSKNDKYVLHIADNRYFEYILFDDNKYFEYNITNIHNILFNYAIHLNDHIIHYCCDKNNIDDDILYDVFGKCEFVDINEMYHFLNLLNIISKNIIMYGGMQLKCEKMCNFISKHIVNFNQINNSFMNKIKEYNIDQLKLINDVFFINNYEHNENNKCIYAESNFLNINNSIGDINTLFFKLQLLLHIIQINSHCFININNLNALFNDSKFFMYKFINHKLYEKNAYFISKKFDKSNDYFACIDIYNIISIYIINNDIILKKIQITLEHEKFLIELNSKISILYHKSNINYKNFITFLLELYAYNKLKINFENLQKINYENVMQIKNINNELKKNICIDHLNKLKTHIKKIINNYINKFIYFSKIILQIYSNDMYFFDLKFKQLFDFKQLNIFDFIKNILFIKFALHDINYSYDLKNNAKIFNIEHSKIIKKYLFVLLLEKINFANVFLNDIIYKKNTHDDKIMYKINNIQKNINDAKNKINIFINNNKNEHLQKNEYNDYIMHINNIINNN
jgi:hypothetical protein